jgi:hypothetical protein
MLIDCSTCVARDIACGGCVVRLLLDGPAASPAGIELDADEQAALGTLAQAGLVPPLRLVRPVAEADPSLDPGLERSVDGAGRGSPGRRGFGSRGIA